MEIVFGILGILGGILCAIGDVLFDYKGKGNETLGRYRFIESNWSNMATWRFKASIMLAAAGVPLYFLGFTSLAMQISNAPLAMSYWITCLIGSAGGLFIHGLLCVFPVLYKALSANRSFEETEKVLNAAYDIVKIPFFFHHAFLVIISSVLVCVAIIIGCLSLPVWTIAFTPLSMMIIGIISKIAAGRELPGITSLGIAMTGLMAILNQML